MMGATMIRERMTAGYVVELERAGTVWRLPADPDLYRPITGDVPCWFLHDTIHAGDRIIVPEQPRPFVLGMCVDVHTNVTGFWSLLSPWTQQISLWLASHTVCPACGSYEIQTLDIPTDLTPDRLYTVRTCIVCDHSWQETADGE